MRAGRHILAAMLVVISAAAVVRAQATQPIENPIRRAAGSTGASTTQPVSVTSLDAGRVVLALAAVLGLILLMRLGIRRLAPGAVGRSARGIQVVSRTYLGPKRQVLVLQIGRRLLVVGDSGQTLSPLCEITDPDEAAVLLAQIQGKRAEAGHDSFAEVMKHASEQFTPPAPNPAPSDPALDSARTELNGLAQRARILAKHLNQS